MASENPGVKWNEEKCYNVRKCAQRNWEEERESVDDENEATETVRVRAATIWQGFCVRPLELSSTALDDNETWTQVSGH